MKSESFFEKRSNLIRFFKESIGDYIDSARAAKKKKKLVAFISNLL